MLQPPNAALTFLLALFAGWVNRQQQRVIEYLVEENLSPRPGAAARPPSTTFGRDRLGGVVRYGHRAA